VLFAVGRASESMIAIARITRIEDAPPHKADERRDVVPVSPDEHVDAGGLES
jgi:hypothetical protein